MIWPCTSSWKPYTNYSPLLGPSLSPSQPPSLALGGKGAGRGTGKNIQSQLSAARISFACTHCTQHLMSSHPALPYPHLPPVILTCPLSPTPTLPLGSASQILPGLSPVPCNRPFELVSPSILLTIPLPPLPALLLKPHPR